MRKIFIEQDDTKDILLKAWETSQALAKSNGESAWNTRAWGVSVWSALVAYAYTSNKPEIIYVSVMLLAVVFLIEVAIRQIQYQYIKRSLEIETCLNSILVGEDVQLPEKGVSTNIDTPTLTNMKELLAIKRWLIWFPYLLLIFFSLLAANLFPVS